MKAVYNSIGKDYDGSRAADTYLCSRMIEHLRVNNSQYVLDVGCGTGNYTIALAKEGLSVIGMDPSETMLKKAQFKNPSIPWIQGKVENIPQLEFGIDAVLCSLTMHHWDSISIGFKQIRNTLKESGRLVLFTSLPEQTRGYWLSHYFPATIEKSAVVMPTLEDIEAVLSEANFSIVELEKYFVREDLEDRFLYCGKHHPERYLNPRLRQAISSFSLFAHQAEIQKGLKQLEKDIQSGNIHQIVQEYNNDWGDYLFIVAE